MDSPVEHVLNAKQEHMLQQGQQLLVRLVQRDHILQQEQEVARNVQLENIKDQQDNLLVALAPQEHIQQEEQPNVQIVRVNVQLNVK